MTIKWYNKHAKDLYDRIIDLDLSYLCFEFLKNLPKNSYILDAGCGIGKFAKIFIEKGHRVEAFDASFKLVQIATKYCGIKVHKLRFQEMNYEDQFDGIWANASLLHLSKAEIKTVFPKFIKSMKKNAIWQLSFKYGQTERYNHERFFNDYTEKSLRELVDSFPMLKIIKIWKSKDSRKKKKKEYWVYVLLKKRNRDG